MARTKKAKKTEKKNDVLKKASNKIKKTGKKIENDIKEKTKNKPKKHVILVILMGFLIIIAGLVLLFTLFIIISSPDFDVDKLYKSSSSIIYDSEGNTLAELGIEKRDNVTYDELPDVLVDAIVATEDSKYFQHNGVDLMRFSKAVVGQLTGQSGAGGASTLTMQVVKNTYSDKETEGIRGIIRKFTDIYMAVFKVEKSYTKQEIIEFYVNQPFLGSQSYGVEQASETFFGKSVGELNLSEAATIAGLFQAPGAYDPYIYPEAAEARRATVLSLMVRHKYITQEEADIAKSIPVKDLLVGNSNALSTYQGFVDTVVKDVEKKTGNNPYTTSMTIYSTMIKSKQDAINSLYAGETYHWVNDDVQCGIAVTSAKNGAVVAVGTGRNRTGEMQQNFATDIKRQPGSTAKPIFDYGPAIEYEGWGTGTTVIDDVYTYSNGTPIHDVDGRYLGILTAKQALAKSRNIPALQAFQATTQQQKYDFVTRLGITPELANGEIMESASIGAFTGVSPLELSAAYGTFARGGYYIEPYTFTKIVYNDTNETYTYTPKKTKAMSEETAFMINKMLNYAVTSGEIAAGYVSGTDLASKTGTASIDYKAMGLPSSAISDAWQVAYTPDYAIATWYGYEYTTTKQYLRESEGWSARRTITQVLVKGIMESGSTWEKPSGVVTVTIETGTNPVQLANAYTPAGLRSTEYFKKGTEPTESSYRFSQLDDVTNLTSAVNGNNVTLSWTAISDPAAINNAALQEYFNKNYSKWAARYYQNRVDYNNSNVGELTYDIYRKEPDGTLTKLGSTPTTSFTTKMNSAQETYVVKSAYSILKSTASNGAEVTVKNPNFENSVEDIINNIINNDNTGENENTGP